jgi:hypothetical protein
VRVDSLGKLLVPEDDGQTDRYRDVVLTSPTDAGREARVCGRLVGISAHGIEQIERFGDIRITMIAEVLTGPFDFHVRSDWSVNITLTVRSP